VKPNFTGRSNMEELYLRDPRLRAQLDLEFELMDEPEPLEEEDLELLHEE
jgi:hypothetical protein